MRQLEIAASHPRSIRRQGRHLVTSADQPADEAGPEMLEIPTAVRGD
jgi:hypothetical protein